MDNEVTESMRQRAFVQTLDEMTKDDFGMFLIDCYRVYQRKNKDYGSSGDRWANFRESLRLGLGMSKAVAIRLSDKFSRFYRGVEKDWNMSVAETMKDTCIDIINYVIIYFLLWNEEKQHGTNSGSTKE